MIYLDNAATTRISESVMNAMMPYLTSEYGNPGALYTHGLNAKKAVDKAREQVAGFMNCDPDQIVFTSSGSEGNNMIIKGVFMRRMTEGSSCIQIAVSSTEHESVLNACRDIIEISKGSSYLCVHPDSNGVISPENIIRHINTSTCLVSVMYVNNETGAVNDIKTIADLCHDKGVPFHTDCVQAAGIYPIDVKNFGCDYATISAHKLHGPKGIGAVYIKDRSTIVPLISGSFSQEHGLRGGTENVAGIVGFAQACEDLMHTKDEYLCKMMKFKRMKTVFCTRLISALSGYGVADAEGMISVNSAPSGRILNLMVRGIDAQTLVLAMDTDGVCVSAGSACCAHDIAPSHVLTAMGLSAEEAASSVRISFSDTNTEEEAVMASEIMAKNIIILLGANAN